MSDGETTSHPAPDADATTAAEAQEQADFGAGFEAGRDVGRSPSKPAKTETAETPRTEAKPDAEDDRVDVSRKEWAEIRAFAARAASYDQQFSKLFGTVGNLSKKFSERMATEQAGTPAGRKVAIPREAFAEMERDFPELARHTRGALEAALADLHGTGGAPVDAAQIEALVADFNSKREVASLDEEFPDWRDIVGAVDVTMQQPPDNAFRRWLSQQDIRYQTRINASDRASTIAQAIRRFQKESAAPKPATAPRNAARADRIRAAVQPRGDQAGGGSSGAGDEDSFVQGFNSR
jgi:hypothetical protein